MSRALCLLLLSLTSGAAQADATGACSGPAYRQLDFWLGDWDVYDDGGKGPVDARNQVTSILGGCALHMLYQQQDGFMGEAFAIYDASRQLWNQTFVTNRGTLLVLEGRFTDSTLTLTGDKRDKDGKTTFVKEVRRQQGDGVREIGYSSKDGGKTWDESFDILYRRHTGDGAR